VLVSQEVSIIRVVLQTACRRPGCSQGAAAVLADPPSCVENIAVFFSFLLFSSFAVDASARPDAASLWHPGEYSTVLLDV